jgi:hypothetical protein
MLSLELETKWTVGAVLGLNNSFPNSKAEGLVKEEILDLSVDAEPRQRTTNDVAAERSTPAAGH